jgi:hypothetical protein
MLPPSIMWSGLAYGKGAPQLLEPYSGYRVLILGLPWRLRMPQNLDVGMLLDSVDDFQRRVLDELLDHLHRCEREAAESGSAVLGEFMFGDHDKDEPLLRVRFICEPGEAARVIGVDSPEEIPTSSNDAPPPGALH